MSHEQVLETLPAIFLDGRSGHVEAIDFRPLPARGQGVLEAEARLRPS